MDQIIRHGAYGVVMHNSEILLNQKKSGPYKGLWDLPGGAIEFGETPEETLTRELMEESCIATSKLEFLSVTTSTGKYHDHDIPYGFHQVGLLYKILDWKQLSGLPEEENHWFKLINIPKEKLTPFALHAISILPQNEAWRPLNKVRGKAIGLVKHDNKLLVFEVLDDYGKLKGWCPIGGGIEFGETAKEALVREVYEELKCDAIVTGNPIICENIFEHHGSMGHEIIFAFPIKLSDHTIYTNNRFQIHEERGSTHWVEWISLEQFESGEATLFPSILVDKLATI